MTCPECGYDLFGIPDVRCPECGFRYDATALRSIATTVERVRWVGARSVIVRSVMGGALALPAACNAVGIYGLWQGALALIACLAALAAWVLHTDNRRTVAAIPNLLIWYCPGAIIVGILLPAFPLLGLTAGVVLVVLAWVSRVCHWPALQPPSDFRAARLHRTIHRDGLRGTIYLVLATAVVVVAVIG